MKGKRPREGPRPNTTEGSYGTLKFHILGDDASNMSAGDKTATTIQVGKTLAGGGRRGSGAHAPLYFLNAQM